MKRRRTSLVTDFGFIVFGALITGVGYGIEPSNAHAARVFSTAALFGAFAAYLVVFRDEPEPRHRSLARICVGAVFGLAVGAMNRLSPEASAVVIVLGAILGYFGSKWAKHI
jgi:uncharacterized membrane protein YfcA